MKKGFVLAISGTILTNTNSILFEDDGFIDCADLAVGAIHLCR